MALTGDPVLLLVPTELEERRLGDLGGFEGGLAVQASCGFGPIAAAARTAELIARQRPARVVLVGIAGTFDAASFPVGTARAFGSVAIDGIGSGEGSTLVGPSALGFPQWPGRGPGHAIGERLPLAAVAAAPDARALLLTTCAASASPAQAAQRRERFPDALAEDMEAYGVAFACALAGVPCTVVRGASNVVGDRDAARWRIPAALAAARLAALAELGAVGSGAARVRS